MQSMPITYQEGIQGTQGECQLQKQTLQNMKPSKSLENEVAQSLEARPRTGTLDQGMLMCLSSSSEAPGESWG